jgi:hypothetical protein
MYTMLQKWISRSRRVSIWSLVAAMTLGLLAACGGGDGGGTPPAAPTQVSVAPGDKQVTIEWGPVAGATSYNVYWSTTDGVTKTTGTKIPYTTSPYVHGGLTNGTVYYYVVTAVGSGGESAESPQVAAKPMAPAPGAPTNVKAELTPETTKSVTLTWDPPTTSSGGPLTYNVYRSLTANVDIAAATTVKLESVVSPYIDVVPAGQVTYYYVITAVDAGTEGPASAEVSATPRGSKSGGGGGGDTGFGSNLSEPVVFADGLGLTGLVITGTDYKDLATGLRPTAGDTTTPFPYLNPDDIVVFQNVDYYPQRTSSTWQASWINGSSAAQHVVVDWGDNLRSASLSSGQSVIRVETNLLQDKGVSPSWPATEAMTGYPMTLLGGQGKSESQGTTGVSQDATRRRVFTVNARLTIQKLDAGGAVIVGYPCNFTGSIAEGFGLEDSNPAKYGSEINVAGSLTYGYNWKLGSCAQPDKAGAWRITFSLDPTSTVNSVAYPNNVVLDSVDPADTTSVLVDPTTSYIDITVN